MRRSRGIAGFLILVLSIFNSIGQKKDEWDFQFPLGIEPVVSGSFGELRANHFHSGVDFATQGRIGLPVFAIDNGHISRIVISPVGYGKALYIEHSNGFTSVYAHLNDFAPKIESIITNLQYEKESFAIEQYFRPGEIVVKKGEVIAYSGNTGSSGGPHLHFEIRETEQQKPVNVHFFNLPVKDDVSPHIEAVCIYPLDDNSTVNGKNTPLYIPAVFSHGQFYLKGNPKINVSGNIGLGIETIDYFTGSWRRCGVYSIQLKVDGKDWFISKLDGFLFSQTRYLNSHIDYGMRQTNKRVIQKSYLDVNNLLDIYHVTSEKGKIKTQEGINNEIIYEVSDASGNTSLLKFILHGTTPPKNSVVPVSTAKRIISATKSHSVELEKFKVKFPANTFYYDVPESVKLKPNNGVGIGEHFVVMDPSVPVHNFFEISLPIPEPYRNQKGLVGARFNNANGLGYAGGKREGSMWVINTRETGTYCLSVDTIAPSLRIIQPPQNRNYSQRNAIKVEIKDNFSGVKDYKCTINGNWALFEYDPKNNLLTGYLSKLKIEKGVRYLLEIKVNDNAGNVQVLKTEFNF